MNRAKIIAAFLAASIIPGAAMGCATEEKHATGEECRIATENTEVTELKKGIWITPRKNLITSDEAADERFAEITEAGINLVHIHPSDCSDEVFVRRQLKAAANNGIKVVIELPAPSDSEDIKNNIEIVKYAIEYPSLYGFNLQDEPTYDRFDILKEEYDEVRKAAGNDKVIFVNLLPNYGPEELMAPQVKKGMTWYQTYVNKTADYDCSDIICFDFYPYHDDPGSDKENIHDLISNICDVLACAIDSGKPAWAFIQDSSWDGMRPPRDSEVRFQTHLYLAFGYESFTYFYYCQTSATSDVQTMLTYKGKRTEIYERVQKIDRELDGLKGRYLNYSFDGVLVKCAPQYISSAVPKRFVKSLNKSPVKKLTGSDILISTFKSKNASDSSKALYVLNTNTGYEDNAVTITFRKSSNFTVWGSEGIEDMGTANVITVNLKPGEGKFIELEG